MTTNLEIITDKKENVLIIIDDIFIGHAMA